MNGLKEICACGCDVSTHFQDTQRDGEYEIGTRPKSFRGRCLGLKCDCSVYRVPGTPDPATKLKRTDHAKHCRCLACKQYLGLA